ncbi:MAG: ATP-binding protein [Gammaproteobacteria bacterium]|nr:ATP-binding protein [Gammaproteobacteria bacterium]
MAGLERAFPVAKEGWLVVPVMGRRGDPIEDLRQGIAKAVSAEKGKARTRLRKTDSSGRDVLDRLHREAMARSKGGVLVVVDEMGKYLESASSQGADIHFFQELAEAAGRCPGRLVVVGILHQGFEHYAARLGREVQDEWAKVQGRYVDIPIVTASDEVIDLIGRAIDADIDHPGSLPVAKKIAQAIRRRRPGSPSDLAERLDACWPLHPATAALLGPVSRRRFGQNERSVFGFLSSREPEGFQEFLRAAARDSDTTYDPARLWDYLKINLEPAILASPDGHRWAQAAEALERCESKGTELHIRVAKSIALIDLFRNGSGLVPEPDVLYASFRDASKRQVDQALADLEVWSVAVFRKHLNAWAIYAGSDFDINEAVEIATSATDGFDLRRLKELAHLQPLLAKEHYHRTGTLRWFDTDLVSLDELEHAVASYRARRGSSGTFMLAIPAAQDSESEAHTLARNASTLASGYPAAIGVPRNAWLIRDLGSELVALEDVRTSRPELEGDAIARREIVARVAAISAQLEEELRAAFGQAMWYLDGEAHDERGTRALSQLVSHLADQTYASAPVIHSELVNREKPSSNSQAAVRVLLHAMVNQRHQPRLGIEGYPAERGLYSTLLESAGMHREIHGQLGFCGPSRSKVGRTFRPMWREAERILKSGDELIALSAIYEAWSAPPFGVRRGVLPIYGLAFVLANESSIAVYADGVFQPELDDFLADRLLQDESQISLRYVEPDAEKDASLIELADAIGAITGNRPTSEPLAVARALVEFVFRLPNWTRRTSSVSSTAQSIRRILLNADDPHRTLFTDLPEAIGHHDATSFGFALGQVLQELADAHGSMIQDLQAHMLDALGHTGAEVRELWGRANAILGTSGDLRLDAFVTRIAEFDGTQESMEAIAGLVLDKPVRDWSDLDPNKAAIELADLAQRFRQIEALARVKGREPAQHAVAVVFGTAGSGRTAMKNFYLPDSDRDRIGEAAQRLLAMLRESGLQRELLLAALAEAGVQVIEEEDLEAGQVAAS